MDRSLEKIDLMKLLLFLILFIVVVFFLIFTIVIPKIKEHRVLKAEYERALVYKTRAEARFLERETQLNTLQEENDHIIRAMVHPFAEEELIAFAQKSFATATITPLMEENTSLPSHVYELNVTASSRAPAPLYAFLEGINQYDTVVQVNFPIYLKLVEKEKILMASFRIKTYDLNATLMSEGK